MGLLCRSAASPAGRNVVLLLGKGGYFRVLILALPQWRAHQFELELLGVASPQNSFEAQRRSSRIRAQIPVRITSLDPELSFTERCHTLVVNTQGCGLRLTRALPAGTQVTLDELPTGVTVTGMVANAVPLGGDKKYWLVGVALDEVGNIWGIHPTPVDWGENTVIATEATAAASNFHPTASPDAKKNEWPYSQFSRRGEFHPGRK
jgi:hypothetical protein